MSMVPILERLPSKESPGTRLSVALGRYLRSQDADLELFRAALERHGAEAIREALPKDALHVAAASGSVQCCQLLIEELGVDVNVRDAARNTPLRVAAGLLGTALETANTGNVVLLLVRAGADVNARNRLGRGVPMQSHALLQVAMAERARAILAAEDTVSVLPIELLELVVEYDLNPAILSQQGSWSDEEEPNEL